MMRKARKSEKKDVASITVSIAIGIADGSASHLNGYLYANSLPRSDCLTQHDVDA